MKKDEWVLNSYHGRTTRSGKLYKEMAEVIPGGVTSNVKFFPPYPIFMRQARGSHLWDVDGNEYMDYCLCYGPLILGHGHPAVWRALEHQWHQVGTSLFGTPHEMELAMARRIQGHYPAARRLRFTNSGTEATLNALRVARTYSRKKKIAKFEGHYHGIHDEVLVSVAPKVEEAGAATSPRSVPAADSVNSETLKSVVVLPFNDQAAAERRIRRNRRTIAAVIVEPIARGFLAADPEFLKGLREVTAALDIPLIFDEVMSGFRIGIGGAQAHFGVTPDLMALGKVIGGGLPLGAFAGREDLMELVSPVGREASRNLFHSGTYNGNPFSLAAGMATLDILERSGAYEKLNGTTEELKKGIQEAVESRDLPVQVLGLGSVFVTVFTDLPIRNYRDATRADARRRYLFDVGLLNRGIYVRPGKPFYLSTEHSSEDVERTIEAVDGALHDIAEL